MIKIEIETKRKIFNTNFFLNTPKYIIKRLRLTIGPATKKASLELKGNWVKVAATNASAIEHKDSTMAKDSIKAIEEKWLPAIFKIAGRETNVWNKEATRAPKIRYLLISKKSFSAC